MKMSASRNLADAVEFTPGIRVEANCQSCNFSQIRMLGLQGPYTQILFDGQPTMSSLAQVYGTEQIPARMVERIEVVKGGGSAVYGPGSVGGVVNVVSHVPSKPSGFVLGSAGWMNGVPNQTLSASADWASSDRNSAVTVFGQADRIRPLDIDGDGFTEVAKRDFDAMGARYRQNLFDQKAELTFDFNHLREDRRGGDLLHLPPDQANIAEAIGSRRYAGGVSWHHTPNTGFDYRLALSLARTNRDTYYGAGMDPDAYGESRNPLWVLDSQFNHFLSSHILSWGGQVTTDGIEDIQPGYNRFYDETYRNVGFFVQDDWFLVSNLELIYGARVDKHNAVDSAIFSPRVALMWTVVPTLNVRTSVATGFLPPQVFDEDLHITQVAGEAHIHRNAEDLKEERSNTYTLGMEWKPSWGRGAGLVEFNLFQTRMKDLFHVVEDDDPETAEEEFTRVNFGEAKVYGAELNFGYALSIELEFQAGYVEQRSRFSEAEPDFGSRDFFRTPNRYGLITLIYRNPRWVDLFFGARFTGAMKVPHYAGYILEDRLETSPAHRTLDASVSKSFPFGSDAKLVVTLGGKNLTDYYQDDLDQGPDRDSAYVWGPRFPRSVYVSTSVEF
jgi:outer membrane receptor for ferrienterochelin and colicins